LDEVLRMTAKSKSIIVKQIEEAPVAAEILAESIVTISKGVKKLMAGPLADDALVLLIQEAAGGRGKVSQGDVRLVLKSIGKLEELYVRRKVK
jgi:hypothetical protein